MSPKHAPRRARIVWHDAAEKQITAMTPGERERLDPVLVAISLNPQIGTLGPSGQIREYRQDRVRVLYVATALGTIVIVAYVEA